MDVLINHDQINKWAHRLKDLATAIDMHVQMCDKRNEILKTISKELLQLGVEIRESMVPKELRDE